MSEQGWHPDSMPFEMAERGRKQLEQEEAEKRVKDAAEGLLSMCKAVEPIVRRYGQPITHDFLLAAIRKAEPKWRPN